MESIIRNMFICVILVLMVSVGTEAHRKYTILEGDNLLVICNVSDSLPDIDVYWTKKDTNDKSDFYRNGSRLEILDIKSDDSGDYVCHALNTSLPEPDSNETAINRTVEVIKVDVEYAARILSFNVYNDVVRENGTFTIECSLWGNPGPNWSIRNRDTGVAFMTATNGGADASLTSPAATCDYTGYWECTGYNRLNHGVNVTRGHNVSVLCSPRPVYQQNNYTVTSLRYRTTFLVLKVHSNPPPTYTWSRDDGRNMTSSVTQFDDGNISVLEFKNVSIPDFGKYKVKMENEYGYNYAHYELKANGPPERPTNIQASFITDVGVTLQWTPGYDMGSRQYFSVMKLFNYTSRYSLLSVNNIYCNYTNFAANQTCSYRLTNLFSNTDYHLAIEADNENGFYTLSKDSVRFRTQPAKSHRSKSERNFDVIFWSVLGGVIVLMVVVFIVCVISRWKFRKYNLSDVAAEQKRRIINKPVGNKY